MRPLLLLALFSAAPAQRAEVRDASAAASCLRRFADGKRLPPVPAVRDRGERDAQRLADLMAALPEGDGSPASEARRRLRHCLPPSLRFDAQLQPEQARWLSTCFVDAARALTRAGAALDGARRERDACARVGSAMATWDPDVGAAVVMGRAPAAPGVRLQSVGAPSHVNAGEARLLDALDAAGPALGACREAHGEGTVRVVAWTGPEGWSFHAWPAGAAPEALRGCVLPALAAAPPPGGEPWSVALEVELRAP